MPCVRGFTAGRLAGWCGPGWALLREVGDVAATSACSAPACVGGPPGDRMMVQTLCRHNGLPFGGHCDTDRLSDHVCPGQGTMSYNAHNSRRAPSYPVRCNRLVADIAAQVKPFLYYLSPHLVHRLLCRRGYPRIIHTTCRSRTAKRNAGESLLFRYSTSRNPCPLTRANTRNRLNNDHGAYYAPSTKAQVTGPGCITTAQRIMQRCDTATKPPTDHPAGRHRHKE